SRPCEFSRLRLPLRARPAATLRQTVPGCSHFHRDPGRGKASRRSYPETKTPCRAKVVFSFLVPRHLRFLPYQLPSIVLGSLRFERSHIDREPVLHIGL